jgi:hypothetical protein
VRLKKQNRDNERAGHSGPTSALAPILVGRSGANYGRYDFRSLAAAERSLRKRQIVAANPPAMA